MRRIFVISLLPFFLLASAAAKAHAVLDHASPLVGSTVRTAPRTISLWFSQNVEQASSAIEVRDARGTRVEQGKARVDRRDRSLLQIELKPLPPGSYEVRWRVLSVDKHATEGSFGFRVGDQ
jgi:copper resistance protein C